MPEIEFDPVDTVTAGAVGEPGHRVFYIHATKEDAAVTVKLEKEQVAILADRLLALLRDVVEVSGDEVVAEQMMAVPPDDVDPLFRALAIGLGYDPSRAMVLVELHENAIAADDDDEEGGTFGFGDDAEDSGGAGAGAGGDEGEEPEGFVARLHLTPAQAQVMAERGAEAVAGGRPLCQLCGFPMDPEGHMCPATNGHKHL